ncbi:MULTISPECIES: transposase [Mesorhizobium]|nr:MULTISPECIES: transposase [Mesorhizobium]MCF6110259.1 transposase [Mesorhizobium muleiense]
MSGVGPQTALAISGFAPPMESFKRGRDFAAWLGLVPSQYTSCQTASKVDPARHPILTP